MTNLFVRLILASAQKAATGGSGRGSAGVSLSTFTDGGGRGRWNSAVVDASGRGLGKHTKVSNGYKYYPTGLYIPSVSARCTVGSSPTRPTHKVFYSLFSLIAEKIKGLRYDYLLTVDAILRRNIRPSYRKVIKVGQYQSTGY